MTTQPIQILVVGNRRDFEQFCRVQRISPYGGRATHVHAWYQLRGHGRDRTLVILLPHCSDLRDWESINAAIQLLGLATKEFDPWKERS